MEDLGKIYNEGYDDGYKAGIEKALTEARKKWVEEEIALIKSSEWVAEEHDGEEPIGGYYMVDQKNVARLEAELKALDK